MSYLPFLAVKLYTIKQLQLEKSQIAANVEKLINQQC